MYGGARPCRDLKTMISDSLLISSSMVFQLSLFTSGRPDESKRLPVIIRAALFCNFATG